MKFIANFFSLVFQPLFLPVYAYLLYAFLQDNTNYLLRSPNGATFYNTFLVVIIIVCTIIPLISLFVMKKSAIVSSMHLPNREERIPVMLLVFMYYLFTYYLFWKANGEAVNVFGAFMSFLSGGLIISVLSILITLKWKISLHAIGISALAGAFVGMTELLYPFKNFDQMVMINVLLIASIGIVGTSRLILKAHSTNQVLAGIILGFGVEYLVVSNGYWFH